MCFTGFIRIGFAHETNTLACKMVNKILNQNHAMLRLRKRVSCVDNEWFLKVLTIIVRSTIQNNGIVAETTISQKKKSS